jgi:hypothetical protein
MSPETVCFLQIQSLAHCYAVCVMRRRDLLKDKVDRIIWPLSAALLRWEEKDLAKVKANLELEMALYRVRYQVGREQTHER